MKNSIEKSILIYDNDCKLCQQAVKFLKIKNGPSGFEFIPSTDPVSDKYLITWQLPKETTGKSVILIENNKVYTKSTAVIKALQKRGGIWRISVVLLVIPAFMRNLVYDLVARNRKRW